MEISVLQLRDSCEPWCCTHSGPGLCILPQPLHPGPLRALSLILPSSTGSRTPAQGRAAPDPGSCVAFSDEHLGFLPKSMFRAHSAVSVSPAAAGHMEGVHHL